MSVVSLATAFRATAPSPATASETAFRAAMRQLASGVSLVTIGEGEARIGMTATAVCSYSAEPPSLLVCLNRGASIFAALKPGARFSINVLSAGQGELADVFAGRTGLKGAERFREARWEKTPAGAPALYGAAAVLDGEVEELIERHTQASVIARVAGAAAGAESGALVYWRGGYDQVGWSPDQIARAVGVTPRP